MTEIFSNKKRKANIEQCKNSIGKIADNMTSVLLKKALRERGYRENDHNDMFFISIVSMKYFRKIMKSS